MGADDTLNSINALISKFVGKNNWIFLLSVTVSCASGIYFHDILSDVWWLISVGVLCSTILVLNALTFIATKVFNFFRQIFVRRKYKRENIKKQEQNRLKEIQAYRTKIERMGDYYWPFVEFVDISYVEFACVILQLPMSNNNKYIRFLKHPEQNFGEEFECYKAIGSIVSRFEYYDDRRQHSIKFLQIRMQKHGCLIEIDEYFYLLLEHYSKTKKWERVYYESCDTAAALS